MYSLMHLFQPSPVPATTVTTPTLTSVAQPSIPSSAATTAQPVVGGMTHIQTTSTSQPRPQGPGE